MLDFGALRSLLQQEPGEATWLKLRQLLQRLDTSALEQFNATLRPYCEEHLAGWPDAIERALTSQHLKALQQGAPPPIAALTNQLSLYRVTGDALRATIKSLHALAPLKLLRAASLTYCGVDHMELALMLDALRGAPLRTLRLYNNPLDRLTALAASELARDLHTLDLFGSPLQDRHSAQLLSGGALAQLCTLHINSGVVGPLTLHALAASDALPALQDLSLSDNQLDDMWVAPLLTSQRHALTALNLGNSFLTDASAQRLADVDNLPNLRALRMVHTELGDRGLTTLLRSPRMAQLTALDIGSTRQATPATAAALLARAEAPQLTALSINSLGLDAALMAQVAQGPLLSSVAQLTLNHNPLGDDGARALAAATGLTRLRALNLQSCGIGPDGLAALLDAPWARGLERLDLAANPLGDAGARLLAHAALPHIKELVLAGCDITRAGDHLIHRSATLPEPIRAAHKP